MEKSEGEKAPETGGGGWGGVQKEGGRKRVERGGREGEGAGGVRWQVDYGRRSRCLETAGTRDARLPGDRHDAMTSAV